MSPLAKPHIAPDLARIPAELRKHKRWVLYRAVFNERREKWDKIPMHPNGFGVSTAKPGRCVSFDAACAALRAKPDQFDGIGYVLTGPHGVVGVDLDQCVSTSGEVAPWAVEVVQQLGGYAELSPSRTGLRVMALGEVPADWTNHDQGIEVYGGHEPRFLTITGHALPSASPDLCAAPREALEALTKRYARERSAPGAEIISLQMPELLDLDALPDLSTLDLPWAVVDFLRDGTSRGDRSREVFAAAVALYRAGQSDDVVLSVLATSPHAWGTAMDHRRQDPDRAMLYLWAEHCRKAKTRAAESTITTADDFEDVSPGLSATPGTPTSTAPKVMFDIQPAWQFAQGKPLTWLIKGLLPHGAVGAVFGASGAGKSFLVLDMVVALARGTPWRGMKAAQADVLYVAAEGAGGVRRRLTAHASYHGYALQDLPITVLGAAPNLLDKTHVDGLIASIKARCPDSTRLIVVDTLAQTTPGANENSSEDMGRALAACQRIARATGCMVLLVAHAGKDTDRGLRGWSGIKGALDVEIMVDRDEGRRWATITKMKDGDEGQQFGFSLESVTLGEDEDGDPITSAVVTETEGSPAPGRKAKRGANQALILRVAETLTALDGETTVQALITAAMAEMPDTGAKAFQVRGNLMRALKLLEEEGALSTVGGVVSLKDFE